MKNSSLRWFFGALAAPLLFASALLAGFSPFPIAVSIVQYGTVLGLLAFALNIVIVVLLFSTAETGLSYGVAMAVIFFLMTAPAGIVLGVGFLKKWTPGKSIFMSTIVGILMVAIFVSVSADVENKSVSTYIEDRVQMGVQFFRKSYEQEVKSKKVTADAQNQINKIFKEYDKDPAKAYKAIKLELIPYLVYFFGLIAWLNGILMVGICRRLPGYDPPWSWEYLIRWRVPDQMIWVTIGVIGLWVFKLEPFEGFTSSGLKILIFIYFLHGISVIGYLFHHYKVVGPMRIIGYMVVILFGITLVAGLGLFDLWWNIREKIENPSRNEEQK
jgi:hypothetical protein